MKAARIGIVFAAAALLAGCPVYATPPPQQPQPVVQPAPTPPPPAVIQAGAPAGAVSIHNVSDWDIHYIYMSSSSDSSWGPDHLGQDILYSGQTFTLSGIACDSYDIKLVDEDLDECELFGIQLCGEHAEWVLTNDELLNCEFGE